MSKYTDFVRAHLKSAPGATQKDKFRAVALMWRKQKGRGLHAPGVKGGAVDDRDWSDWGDKPALNGEGMTKKAVSMLMKSKAARGGKVAAMRMKRGGADTIAEMSYDKSCKGGKMKMKDCYGTGMSGLVSKKQAAALAKHIKMGGATTPGALAALLHGLSIKVE
jgi:hypothetical protein